MYEALDLLSMPVGERRGIELVLVTDGDALLVPFKGIQAMKIPRAVVEQGERSAAPAGVVEQEQVDDPGKLLSAGRTLGG